MSPEHVATLIQLHNRMSDHLEMYQRALKENAYKSTIEDIKNKIQVLSEEIEKLKQSFVDEI